MKKIGFITIGQSPRDDIMKDILPIIGDDIEILQKGALDNLSEEELEEIAPQSGDTVLVSSLRDGRSVSMAEEKIIVHLQRCIDELEVCGVSGIMFLCTGDFKDLLTAHVPLIYPNRLLRAIIPAICDRKRLVVLVPEEEQKSEAMAQWEGIGMETSVFSISPYTAAEEDFAALALTLKEVDCDCVLMDCMGYSAEMKDILCSRSGKNVLLPRTFSAAVLKELI